MKKKRNVHDFSLSISSDNLKLGFVHCQNDGDSCADVGEKNRDQQTHKPFEIAVDAIVYPVQTVIHVVQAIVQAIQAVVKPILHAVHAVVDAVQSLIDLNVDSFQNHHATFQIWKVHRVSFRQAHKLLLGHEIM